MPLANWNLRKNIVGKTTKWAEGSSITRTKYNAKENRGKVDYKTKLDADDDVVRVTLGDDWHTPTLAEIAELMDTTKCTWTWTKRNGVDGYEIKSKINGNSIFLPHTGYMSDDICVAFETVYMSSELTPDERRNTLQAQRWRGSQIPISGNLIMQSITFFYTGEFSKTHLNISCGFPIRPVTAGFCSINTNRSNDTIKSEEQGKEKKGYDNNDNENDAANENAGNISSESQETTFNPEPPLNTDIYAEDETDEEKVTKEIGLKKETTPKSEGTDQQIVDATEPKEKEAEEGKDKESYYLGKVNVEYVDLGLSVKWAKHNVGAASSHEVGSFYCWGETESNNYPSWDTYKWYNSDTSQMTKYCLDKKLSTYDGKSQLEEGDDAARVNWGGKWRLPTPAEWRELMDPNKCEWTWKTVGGLQGYEVKSKNNGNTIFLPAAGYKTGGLTYPASSGTHYMTTMLSSTNGFSSVTFMMKDGDYKMSQLYRVHGILIRPVMQK